jgi:hypothetical protein
MEDEYAVAPPVFTAATVPTMKYPTSLAVTTYVAEVAPEISTYAPPDVVARFH